MSSVRKKPRHLEAIEQRLFIKRLRLDPRTKELPWCSVPNGGKRSPREAALLKAEGVQAGVPDWLLFVRSLEHDELESGLAIEFKSPSGRGRVSESQEQWHRMLEAEAWRVAICTTAEEAWIVVMDYLGYGNEL